MPSDVTAIRRELELLEGQLRERSVEADDLADALYSRLTEVTDPDDASRTRLSRAYWSARARADVFRRCADDVARIRVSRGVGVRGAGSRYGS